MLTHPTLDLLHQLGLNGMAKAFGEIEASGETTTLTHPEWLALLLDQELRSELLLLEVLLLGRRMSTRRTVIPDIAARLRDDLVGRREHNLLVTALELLQERGETFRDSLLDGTVLGPKPYPDCPQPWASGQDVTRFGLARPMLPVLVATDS